MDTANLALRHCLQTERIFVAKVMLGGERQLVDIVYTADIFGLDTHAVHLLLVEGNLLITSLHSLDQTFRL